jgi:ectoine hydroxylase-related dioxygenase (phytanoyl-CoA dioxygenase family)
MTSMTSSPLASGAIRDFERDGFVVVRGLLDGARMRALRTWVDALEAWPETPGRHMMYFEESLLEPGRRILCRVENFYPYHAELRALMDSAEMRGAVSQLFGEPAVLFKDKINFKMSGGEGFKAHQDVQAGWDTYAALHVTAMVSIDRTTAENGCLELAPGQHRRGLIGKSWEPLGEDDLGAMKFVACPTEPGDAVFFDSFVPHRSAPNLTAAQRRVLYITYNRASEGDHRARYYADKRKNYPPDCEREAGKEYVFRV